MTCFVLRLPPQFEEEPSEASHLSKLREIGIAVSDLVVACTVVPETDRDRSGIVCTAYQKNAVNLQPKAQALKSKPSDLDACECECACRKSKPCNPKHDLAWHVRVVRA